MAFGYRCIGRRVTTVAKEWGFSSLTPLRRSDLLGFSKSTDEVHVPALPFIERCDRDPLPMNKGDAPIRTAADLWRETQTRFDRSGVEIYPTFSP
jgi:hypothetical protein